MAGEQTFEAIVNRAYASLDGRVEVLLDDWSWLLNDYQRLQAQLAAQAEVVGEGRKIVDTWNNGPWFRHVAELRHALARLDASAQEARQQAADRAQ